MLLQRHKSLPLYALSISCVRHLYSVKPFSLVVFFSVAVGPVWETEFAGNFVPYIRYWAANRPTFQNCGAVRWKFTMSGNFLNWLR